jgi:hypothetical protein
MFEASSWCPASWQEGQSAKEGTAASSVYRDAREIQSRALGRGAPLVRLSLVSSELSQTEERIADVGF